MPTQDTAPPGWLQVSEAAQTLARTLLERYPAAFCAEPAAGSCTPGLRIMFRDLSGVVCGVSLRRSSGLAAGFQLLVHISLPAWRQTDLAPLPAPLPGQPMYYDTRACGHGGT